MNQRIFNTVSVKTGVLNLLKPFLGKINPMILVIDRNWKEIIGLGCYKYSHAKMVSFERNSKSNGCLNIVAYNSVVAFEIENNSSIIIERINGLFGYRIISRISIKQEPQNIEEYADREKNIVNPEKIALKNKEIDEFVDDESLSSKLKELYLAIETYKEDK